MFFTRHASTNNYVETPTVEGITSVSPQQNPTGGGLLIEQLEYGTEIYNDNSADTQGKISLENGYEILNTATKSTVTYNHGSGGANASISNVSMTDRLRTWYERQYR